MNHRVASAAIVLKDIRGVSDGRGRNDLRGHRQPVMDVMER